MVLSTQRSNLQSKLLLGIVLCVFHLSAPAQFLGNFRSKPTTFQWGWNIIDDNANTYRQLVKIESWYSDFFPGKFSVMKTLAGKLKGEVNVGFAKMKQSYYKDRYIYPGVFTCVDLNFRVQFNPFNKFFDNLYIPRRGNSFGNRLSNGGINLGPIIGLGFTSRTQTVFDRAMTLNIGFTGTYWIKRNKVGITLQSLGKIGLETPILFAGSNYFHHSVGVSFVVKNQLYHKRQRYKKAGRRTQNRVRL
jgi:hypothetical protein